MAGAAALEGGKKGWMSAGTKKIEFDLATLCLAALSMAEPLSP